LAACLGEHFSLQVLGALSRVSEEELLVLLEEGMHQRILLSGGQIFQFVHSLIRHVFYHAPSAARRQRMHQQIAQTLEQLYADSLDEHLLEIAHHLVRAGPIAAVTTVVEYARRAAEQAFAIFAWDEAAYYYEAALSAAESTGQLSVHDQAELHYWAGLAHYWNQDVGPCLDHYEKAIAAYRLTDDVRGLAQALIGKTHTRFTLASVPLGALADLQPLEDVLTALGDRDPELRGHILAIMAEVYRQARQSANAQEMAQRALEIGQCLKDDRLCARASSALALAHINGLYLREAFECWQQALDYAQRTNDLILQGWPLQRMPLALTLQGRLDEAETVALEACTLTRKTSDWMDYSVALSHLASLAVAKGDFEATESRAHETMLMVYRSRYPWGGFRSLCALACARALRGAWAEAEDALDILVEPGHVFEDSGPIIKVFARVFRQLLRVQSHVATEALEPLATELMQVVGTDTYSLGPLCALVELGDLMSAPTMAALPYQALSLAAERGARFSSGWMYLLPRILGVIATLNRQWDTAQTHFQTAIEVATSVGARPELGRTYLEYARLLIARGTTSDCRQAMELVQQAGPLLLALGMQPFAWRVAQLAEALQAHIPLIAQQRATYPDDLSTREVEILRHIAQGRTNQEIADDLILGPQTVADHVDHLFAKIGASNGAAAATYAVEQGLVSQSQPHKSLETPAAPDSIVGAAGPQTLRIILVTDMQGSAGLIQRWGDEQAHELMRRHNAIIRDCLHVYHGAEITHTGDGIEAAFTSASRAVECAMAIQQAFAKHNQEHSTRPMQVRIGINAGEPIVTEGRLFGTAVHTAFRICNRAQPGQILISDVIHQLVMGKDFAFADRGRVVLKGFPGRLRLYEVRWQEGRA
jgi:class 3 adenylate cyclase/DNA-binding NarL/FixJ family response regulator